MKISVAICTFQPNFELLRRVVDAINDQLGGVDAELLVIDNASEPPLDESVLGGVAGRVVAQPVPGLTAAREKAAEVALGDVIVFVDDDNIIGPGYLATVAEDFANHPDLGVLGATVIPEYTAPPPWWIGRYEAHLAVRRTPSGFWAIADRPPYSDAFPIGAGMAARGGIVRAWAESLATETRVEGRIGSSLASGEDVDLDLFALSVGSTIAVDGRLVVRHVIGENRLAVPYLERLVRSATRSTAQVEEKWGPRFDIEISTGFYRRDPGLPLRAFACWVLAPFHPAIRLRWAYYREVLAARAPAPIRAWRRRG